MSESKQLRRLLSQGWISRREFVKRMTALGLAASVPATMLASMPAHGAAKQGGNFRVGLGHGSPPGALLIQDCLERFESLDAALDWCTGRPGGGAATLLLADATGEVAGVEIAAAARRVLRPAEGLLLAGGDASDRAKRLREAAPLGAELLARRLFTGCELVVLDARTRSLRLGSAEFSA